MVPSAPLFDHPAKAWDASQATRGGAAFDGQTRRPGVGAGDGPEETDWGAAALGRSSAPAGETMARPHFDRKLNRGGWSIGSVRCLASSGERASARPPPRRCASRAVRPAVRTGDPGPAGAGGDRGVAAVGPPRTPNVPAWSGGVGEAHPQGGVGAAASGSTSKICCRRTAHRRVASVGATRGAGMIIGGASTAAGSACRRIPRGRLAYQP
jgi:hypothetical protein